MLHHVFISRLPPPLEVLSHHCNATYSDFIFQNFISTGEVRTTGPALWSMRTSLSCFSILITCYYHLFIPFFVQCNKPQTRALLTSNLTANCHSAIQNLSPLFYPLTLLSDTTNTLRYSVWSDNERILLFVVRPV